jgi:hypothetical protein
MYKFMDVLGEKCIPFGEIIGGKEDPEMFDSSKSQPSVEDCGPYQSKMHQKKISREPAKICCQQKIIH